MTSEVFNIDCVEYMRTLPDNFFDVAICDPPYGDADSEKNNLGGGRFGGIFDRYKKPQNTPPHQSTTTSLLESTHKAERGRQNTEDRQPRLLRQIQPMFGGGKLTASYNELTGMLLRRKSFSMNFSALARIKLFGAATTFHCRLRDASWFGENYLFLRNSLWQCASMRGLHSKVMQNYLRQFHNAERIAVSSTPRRSR